VFEALAIMRQSRLPP